MVDKFILILFTDVLRTWVHRNIFLFVNTAIKIDASFLFGHPIGPMYDSNVTTTWMNSALAAAGRFAGRLLGVAGCCQWKRTLCNR